MIPREFGRRNHRIEDALDPAAAAKAFAIPVQRTRLVWEGGNVLSDERICAVGADTVVENVHRFGLTPQEVLVCLEADLGAEPIVFGDVDRASWDVERNELSRSGQASFHIDLDVCLLGRVGRRRQPVALVADPAHGLDLVHHVLDHRPVFRNHALPPRRMRELVEAEYHAYARERHPQLLGYTTTLEALGYQVIGVPDIRVSPEQNVFGIFNLDFGYCNVLPGRNRDRAAVHYLPWGIRALDQAAERQFRKAGVAPIPATSRPLLANRLMQLAGGLHCVCGPLI